MNSYDSMNWLADIAKKAKIVIFYLSSDGEYYVCVGVKSYRGKSLAAAIESAALENSVS